MEGGDVMRGKGYTSLSWPVAPLALVMANIDGQMTDNIEARNDPTELKEFKKWETILPELKRHAIKYFDGETQFHYAQCSRVCNTEVQKFDKKGPIIFRLKNLNGDRNNFFIEVRFRRFNELPNSYGYEMKFINLKDNKHKWMVQVLQKNRNKRMFQNDENAIHDGTALEGALRHMEQRGQLLNQHVKPFPLSLEISAWPNQLSNCLRRFYEAQRDVGQFLVYLNKRRFYENFMEFMENSPICSNLFIEPGHGFIMPPAFFDSKLFKTVKKFSCSSPIPITNEQFLQTKAKELTLKTTNITSEAVHRKLSDWYNNVHIDEAYFIILGPSKDPHFWDRCTVMDSLPFRQKNRDTYIIQKDGITGRLSFACYNVTVLSFHAFSDEDDE